MDSYYTNYFLTFPFCSHSHSWSRNISGNPRSMLLSIVREKRPVRRGLGWKESLLSFISLSEPRNSKCSVGKGVRNRSLALCLEFHLKPGHTVPVVTFYQASSLTKLLTKIWASVLLKKLKFQYYSFIYVALLLPRTYDVLGTIDYRI